VRSCACSSRAARSSLSRRRTKAASTPGRSKPSPTRCAHWAITTWMWPSTASCSCRPATQTYSCSRTTTKAGSAGWGADRRRSMVPVWHIAPLLSNEEVRRQVDVAAPVGVLLFLNDLAAMLESDGQAQPAARDRLVLLEPDIGEVCCVRGVQRHQHAHDDQPLAVDPE